MNKDVPAHSETINIPASAAEAWAAVYIDVAEKLDAEEQRAADMERSARECSTKHVETSTPGEPACPST